MANTKTYITEAELLKITQDADPNAIVIIGKVGEKYDAAEEKRQIAAAEAAKEAAKNVTYKVVIRQDGRIIRTCGHNHKSVPSTNRCSNAMQFPSTATIAVEASDGHEIPLHDHFTPAQLAQPIALKKKPRYPAGW